MVLEYCPGGELFDYIVERDRLEEDEARLFFREIVAAVAYIHQMGYAHRDLKPENLLLDSQQRLKLIDFGLCANPSGGLAQRLATCCGSPAYAAPELVSGRQYLGTETDIWSMGVLLYALLCGFLPFDDENIGTLYRKIQRGDYEEPAWLSGDSRMLLRQMLQTDPRQRITVLELLGHPWLTRGHSQPVATCPMYTNATDALNEHVLAEMSLSLGRPRALVRQAVARWCYDHTTATYLIMLQQQKQPSAARRLVPDVVPYGSPRPQGSPRPLQESPRHMHASLEGGLQDSDLLLMSSPKRSSTSSSLVSSTTDEGYCTTSATSTQASPRKRPRSSQENSPPSTPAPAKRGRRHPAPSRLSPARSHDSGLEQVATPTKQWLPRTPERGTPRRTVFGSIEKSLDRMKSLLTPKRKPVQETGPQTVDSRNLQNVSTTGSNNAEQVLSDLRRALSQRGVFCSQKGYTLRGKIQDPVSGGAKLSFELEVCRVARLGLVGVRRKRLRGDAWKYKKVCEEVLRLAQTKPQPSTAPPSTPSSASAFIASAMMGDAVRQGDEEPLPSSLASAPLPPPLPLRVAMATNTSPGVAMDTTAPSAAIAGKTTPVAMETEAKGTPVVMATNEMATQTDPGTPGGQ